MTAYFLWVILQTPYMPYTMVCEPVTHAAALIGFKGNQMMVLESPGLYRQVYMYSRCVNDA